MSRAKLITLWLMKKRERKMLRLRSRGSWKTLTFQSFLSLKMPAKSTLRHSLPKDNKSTLLSWKFPQKKEHTSLPRMLSCKELTDSCTDLKFNDFIKFMYFCIIFCTYNWANATKTIQKMTFIKISTKLGSWKMLAEPACDFPLFLLGWFFFNGRWSSDHFCRWCLFFLFLIVCFSSF